MLFQHTWQSVISGQKTQTRRLAQGGDQAVFEDNDPSRPITQVVRTADAGVPKVLYQVGKTYSVQPGIAQKTVGQIRLTAIRQERLHDLSENDALQEMPVTSPQPNMSAGQQAKQAFQETWNLMYKTPGSRWEDNPAVWVLEFQPALPGPSASAESPFGQKSGTGKQTFTSGTSLLAQLAKNEPDNQ